LFPVTLGLVVMPQHPGKGGKGIVNLTER